MNAKERLVQAQRDKQLGIIAADKEIDRLEQEIKDAEITYSIGDRFVFDGILGNKILLVELQNRWVGFVRLSTGQDVGNGKKVSPKNNTKITQKEFSEMGMACRYSRYWDNRKQVQV